MSEKNVLAGLKKQIMSDIYENRMLLTSSRDKPGGWKLISGLWSPFYIQLRLISSFPETLKHVGQAMTILLKERAPHVNKIIGIAFAGVPIATAVSLDSGIPTCHTRKLTGVKTEEEFYKALSEYGQHSLVEGLLEEGDRICLVDDLVTGMSSKLIARAQVFAEVKRRGIEDITCDDVAVIVDRQQGARELATQEGMELHSLIEFADEGLPLIKHLMPEEEYNLIVGYLKDPKSHQKP